MLGKSLPLISHPSWEPRDQAARRISADLEGQILAALRTPGRAEGVRKIAERFGVDPSTVQRISRPLDGASAAA
jgi:hypothetical protein